MVIFGATGDLMVRKLLPAIYHLLEQGVIQEKFFIVGVARRPFSDSEFRNLMKEGIRKLGKVEIREEIWEKLEQNLYYQQGMFEDEKPYLDLVTRLKTFDAEIGACITRFFYLATPPQHYSSIITNLDKAKLDEGCGQGSSRWTRVLIEKPFGTNMETAAQLEKQLTETFESKQIYRIDHYLAKETVQNMLAFRFANRSLEAVWNKENIDHVQITLFESGGIGNRGKFYDEVGALRDVAQNHLFAMLAYTAMEEPKSLAAEDIRAERVKVLSCLCCIDGNNVRENVVRGQYGSATINDRKYNGFREEKDINPESVTETYVAFKLFIDNDRWRGVPFYFRTGKRMKQSVVRIDIQFKKPTTSLFSQYTKVTDAHANILTFRIQPKEGITLRFFAKTPELSYALEPVDMDFSYSNSFKREITDSYEKLFIDAMTGDQTLFATGAGFAITWKLANSILNAWKQMPKPEFPNYEPGSWGPGEADELIRRDGRHWLLH